MTDLLQTSCKYGKWLDRCYGRKRLFQIFGMGNGGNLPGVIYFFVFSLVEDYPRLSYQNMKEPIKYVVYVYNSEPNFI